MEQKFVYTGTALGSFEFTGTQAELEKMLTDLRQVAPEFAGEITRRQSLSDYHARNENIFVDCLFYDGEKIAEEIA